MPNKLTKFIFSTFLGATILGGACDNSNISKKNINNNNSTNNLNNTNNTNNINNINNTNNTTCTPRNVFLCQDNDLYVRDINGCTKDDTLVETCVEGDTYCNATSGSCNDCEHTISNYCGDDNNVYQSDYNGCTEVSEETLIETCNINQICNNSTAECECNPNYIESSSCIDGQSVEINACGNQIVNDCFSNGQYCDINTGLCFGNIGGCTSAGYVCEGNESVEVSTCDDRDNGIDGVISKTTCQNSNFEQCIPQTGQCESMAVVYEGKLWERNASGSMTWSEADAYCAGKTDYNRTWEMPNIDELKSLVRDCNFIQPGGSCDVSEMNCNNTICYDPDPCRSRCSNVYGSGMGEGGRFWEPGVWEDFNGFYGNEFWSSTEVANHLGEYFYLGFVNGDLYYRDGESYLKDVRCKSDDLSTPTP